MHPVSIVPHDLAVKLGLIRPDSTLIPIGFWRDDPSTDPAKTAAGREVARYRDEVARLDRAGKSGGTVTSDRTESFRDHADRMAEQCAEKALLESMLPWPGDHVDPGSTERSRGGYVWPSGLSHYVRKYGLRLPAEFLVAIGGTCSMDRAGPMRNRGRK